MKGGLQMTDMEFTSAINLLLNGDKNGLKAIYEAYMKLIYAVVYNTVQNKEEAEDVTSEFFIKLVRVAGSFKKGSPHKTWLVTIAKNMAIDAIRKNKKTVSEYEEPHTSGIEDEAVLSQDIKQAIQTLKPEEKEIVDMKLLGQLKFKDIAKITGKPIGTVTWLYNEGIKKLRRCLSNYEQEDS